MGKARGVGKVRDNSAKQLFPKQRFLFFLNQDLPSFLTNLVIWKRFFLWSGKEVWGNIIQRSRHTRSEAKEVIFQIVDRGDPAINERIKLLYPKQKKLMSF